MLRRKLLVILGTLVGLWLVAAAAAILLLDGVLRNLDRMTANSHAASALTMELAATVSSAETLLIRAERGVHSPERPDVVAAELEAALTNVEAAKSDPSTAVLVDRIASGLRQLLEWVNATTHSPAGDADPQAPPRLRPEGRLVILTPLHEDMEAYALALHDGIEAQHVSLTSRFRNVALGLGATFLILINVSMLMLIRAATMIIQPVEQLVDASRRLAREDFTSRVELDRRDEFGELAHAYNSLAAALGQNEERKIETLRQVAAMLNHELNNAIAIIELQLRLVARGSGSAARNSEAEQDQQGLQSRNLANGDPLRQIHATLARMSRTVSMLKQIRRIVLTDYSSGVKMLDLERSVEADGPVEGANLQTPSAPAGALSPSPAA